MLRCCSLVKRFGAQPVLDGVSLEARPGRVTALVGPNGSGKSTLIKCVLGLVRQDDGEVELCGRWQRDGEAYREELGYMPQAARFPENLTGAEVLELLQRLRPGRSADVTFATELGLGPELSKRVATLSGGTRQKLSAVASLMFGAEVLILDEPTAGLDPVASHTLRSRLALERERGRAVLLTSHVIAELEGLADDVVVLVDGRVLLQESVQVLCGGGRGKPLQALIAERLKEAGG